MGFEIVHVRAVAVHLLADVVTDPVNEVRPEPGVVDHAAPGRVDFPAVKRPTSRVRLFHARNGGVTRGGDDPENLFAFRRNLGADESHPREIAVNSAWPIELGPEVDQHQVARCDRCIAANDRLIVRDRHRAGRRRRSADYTS